MAPEEYAKMSGLVICEDGSVELDEFVLNGVRKVFHAFGKTRDLEYKNLQSFETFVFNMYMVGVWQHLTGSNPIRGENNIPMIICLALIECCYVDERVLYPGNLWNFCVEFLVEYSDWQMNASKKMPGCRNNLKMASMLAERIKKCF